MATVKKKLGILELLGVAVGNIGLPYNDFCRPTPEEFGHVYEAYSSQREADRKDSWERARLMTTIMIQPHLKKKLTPQQLLPLPWDAQRAHKANNPQPTAAESKERFEEMLRRTGEG